MDIKIGKDVILPIIIFIICTSLIQPVFNFLTPKILTFYANVFSSFDDLIYAQAADKGSEIFGESFFSIFLGGMLAMVFSYLRLVYKKEGVVTKNYKSKLDRTLNAIGLVILLLLMSTYVYSSYYLNSRFDRKIRILSPLLTDKQEKEFISRWSIMKNRSDYRLIDNDLNVIAHNNKIYEPDFLWK